MRIDTSTVRICSGTLIRFSVSGTAALVCCEVALADAHHGELAVVQQLQRLQGPGLQGDALGPLVLVEQLVHPVGVDAGLHQLGGEAHRERAGVGELEPAGVGAMREEQRRRDRLVDRRRPTARAAPRRSPPAAAASVTTSLVVGPVLLREVVVDDELRLRQFATRSLEAGELRPRAGVDDEQRVVGVEREVRRASPARRR